MINIDTEQLQNMMRVLQEANNNIDRAADLLLSITTHTGWACKERYTINDFIAENRNLIRDLQEHCALFCNTAKSVTDEFVETESSISQMFSSVESALAQILALPIQSIISNVGIIPDPRLHSHLKQRNVWKMMELLEDARNRWKRTGNIPGYGWRRISDAVVPICAPIERVTKNTSLVDLNSFDLNEVN